MAGRRDSAGVAEQARRPRLLAAPTLQPTEEEWQSGLLPFVGSVREMAEQYGIVKIVPPPSWPSSSPCKLDLAGGALDFKFSTSIQSLHLLQLRSQADYTMFYEHYDAWLKTQGKSLSKWKFPMWQGKDVDVGKLYLAVLKRGGAEQVTIAKQWVDVAKALRVSSPHIEIATY